LTSNRFFVPRSSLGQELVELGGEEHHHLSRSEPCSRRFFLRERGGRPIREFLGQKPRDEAGSSVLAAVILLWNP